MATETTLGARILSAVTAWSIAVQDQSEAIDGDSWEDSYDASVDEGMATLRALCARADAAERLADDAAAFVERLLAVHGDGRYRLVWELAQNHMGPYQGPFYTAELDKLIATLAAWRALGEVGSGR